MHPAITAPSPSVKWTVGQDRFQTDDHSKGGSEIRFEPLKEKVGLRPGDLAASDEYGNKAIYNVTGLDQPFVFQLLVKRDLVDLCIDDRRTLIARTENIAGRGFFLFAQNAKVTLKKLQLRPF